LILDLDETLVHSQFKQVKKPDYVIPVDIEGRICNIFVLKRPGTDHFLRTLAQHYELVIYTASLSKVTLSRSIKNLVRRPFDGHDGPSVVLHSKALPRALHLHEQRLRKGPLASGQTSEGFNHHR
jgi:TFIIF-interacting CTD phosphatase-like protein